LKRRCGSTIIHEVLPDNHKFGPGSFRTCPRSKTCPYDRVDILRPEAEGAMTRRTPYLLVAASALTLSGCTYYCRFEARGLIRDAADGRPIPNARVELLDSDRGKPHVLGSGSAAAATTDPQGQFQVAFRTIPSGEDELTGWTAKLSAEGYEPATIAIGPVKEPKGGQRDGVPGLSRLIAEGTVGKAGRTRH
jgi:hypothetical protein